LSALGGSRTRLTRETAEPRHQARPRACVLRPTAERWRRAAFAPRQGDAFRDSRDREPRERFSICGKGGAPGNRTPLGWMQATILAT